MLPVNADYHGGDCKVKSFCRGFPLCRAFYADLDDIFAGFLRGGCGISIVVRAFCLEHNCGCAIAFNYEIVFRNRNNFSVVSLAKRFAFCKFNFVVFCAKCVDGFCLFVSAFRAGKFLFTDYAVVRRFGNFAFVKGMRGEIALHYVMRGSRCVTGRFVPVSRRVFFPFLSVSVRCGA